MFNQSDLHIENTLRWPIGTLKVLRSAFEKKRTRNTIGDFRSVGSIEAHKTAALYYMRGASRSSVSREQSKFTIQESPPSDFETFLSYSFVICDEKVLNAWPQRLKGRVHHILRNVSEIHKNLSQVAELITASEKISNAHWLIIGGGITCDLSAYAAHLVGAKFTLVPTTLLAMVDASIGGKTGVNFSPYGKNLVGAFAFPEAVIIFTSWLHTLPDSEFSSGAAECLKHAILSDDMKFLADLSDSLASRNLEDIATYLPSLLSIKTEIVSRDPFEKGERAILNLGHTTAHALEGISMQSEDSIRHGEAVAVGIAFESLLSVELGYRSPEDHKTLLEILKHSKCLVNRKALESKFSDSLCSPDFRSKLSYYFTYDKKTQSSERIPFVLLGQNGKVARPDLQSWLIEVSDVVVRKVWVQFIQSYL